jgi:hypothetical protein
MEKDFIPVSLTATGPNILAVPAASPFKNLNDLLVAARNKPGSLNSNMPHQKNSCLLAGKPLIALGKPLLGWTSLVTRDTSGSLLWLPRVRKTSQHVRQTYSYWENLFDHNRQVGRFDQNTSGSPRILGNLFDSKPHVRFFNCDMSRNTLVSL